MYLMFGSQGRSSRLYNSLTCVVVSVFYTVSYIITMSSLSTLLFQSKLAILFSTSKAIIIWMTATLHLLIFLFNREVIWYAFLKYLWFFLGSTIVSRPELMSPVKHVVEDLTFHKSWTFIFEVLLVLKWQQIVLDIVLAMLIQLCSTNYHIFVTYLCLWPYCVIDVQIQYIFIWKIFFYF